MLIPLLTIAAVFISSWVLASIIESWIRSTTEADKPAFSRKDAR